MNYEKIKKQKFIILFERYYLEIIDLITRLKLFESKEKKHIRDLIEQKKFDEMRDYVFSLKFDE